MRWLVWALLLCGIVCLSQAPRAQYQSFPPGVFTGRAAIDAGASFQGVGDVISSWLMWGSCARVYDAALASTSTSLCDLVATGNGSSVCTLRGTASGKVDLAASYCNSTTPSAACAAANGGSCSVSKVYDQASTHPLTQATLANMPVLTFNVSNGLPCTSWSNVAAATLASAATITQAQPLTVTTVVNHTSGATNVIYGFNTGGGNAFFSSTANTIEVNAGGSNAVVSQSPQTNDGALHALQVVYDEGASPPGTSNSALYSDGTNFSISGAGIGANGIITSNGGIDMSGEGAAFGFNGTICEFGVIAVSMSSTQKSNMNSNQHGTNGYNF